MSMAKWLFAGVVIFFAGGARASWGLNDATVLLPLPTEAEKNWLLSPGSIGLGGSLLPQAMLDEFPTLVGGVDPRWIYGDALRVVALRLDPCFVEGEGPLPCRRQVRFVWQPITSDQTEQGLIPTTLDASIHSFHDFSESEWKIFLREWKARIAGQDPALALDVHPAIRAEGLAGATWAHMRALLLKYCGDQNLTRMTLMQVNGMGTVWVFSAFDRIQGQWQRHRVARINKQAQAFMVNRKDLEFKALINPWSADDQNLLSFLDDSVKARETWTEDDLKSALAKASLFENPRRHNTGTLDCVSCHVAQTIRLWGERRFPQWRAPEDFRASAAGLNLVNRSANPAPANRLRALGYFQGEPLLSQRVINETSMVIEALNLAGD